MYLLKCQMQQAYWNLRLTVYIIIYCKENTAQNSLVKVILSETDQSSNQSMECSSSVQQPIHGEISFEFPRDCPFRHSYAVPSGGNVTKLCGRSRTHFTHEMANVFSYRY
jgi:hypothetical protein